MNQYPLVSICIPTYNGDQFLKECLDSCLDQTFKDYEVVICDDCSTDKTREIIQTYQKENPKIKFFENETNLGLVGNWNRCIAKAEGEWIKFVFQDDYISHDCLSEFIEQAVPGIFLITSQRNFILPDNTNKETAYYYENTVRTLENSCDKIGNIYFPETICSAAIKYMGMNFIAEPSLTCFRKKIIHELGEFNSNLKQICDLEFFLRVASRHGLAYIPKKICSFRIHDQSTTNSNASLRYFEMRYIEPLVFSYLLKYGQEFQPLRNNLNLFQRFKLLVYFRVKLYQAYKTDLKTGHKHVLFSQNNNNFSQITKYRKGNWWVKMLAVIY